MRRLFRRWAGASALAAALAGPAAASPGAQDGAKKVPLDSVLKGSVARLDGTAVEVRYDLAEPAQLEDFTDYKAFQLEASWKREWYDKALHLNGTGSVVWKAILRRKVEMEFDVRLKTPRDFGAYLAEDRQSDELMVFSVFDQFFQNKDRRGSPKVHMICRFTSHAPDAGGDFAFRYCSRSPNPAVGTQKPFHVRVTREGVDQTMEIDGAKMTGNDAWPPLRGLRPGFYVIDSEAFVSNVVIKGDIDPKWAEGAGVDLSLPVKAKAPVKPAEREPTEADLAARQRVDAVRNGSESAPALAPILGNAALLESVREEAAKAMEESGDLKAVPRLVSVMESEDPVARRLAGRVVAKLAGKSFGFAADGPEDGRRRAVRSLLDWIEKNPGKFR